ncbi:MAG: hypothetical protein RLN69_09035 [Woeseiaceae bacterium]
MKRSPTGISWFARLIASAMVVMLSQHAFAAGTTAGTTISNQAQVDYSVGGNAQTFILSDPAGNSVPGGASGAQATEFVVDNRVDFTLVESGAIGHTTVTPGQNSAIIQFTLANDGNLIQDFRVVATNLVGGVFAGVTDTVDMNNVQVYVDNNGNGLETGVDQDFVDELAVGDSVDIYVVADADLLFTNGDGANINLQAVVAAAGAAGLGADLVNDAGNADDPLTVQVVFAEGGGLALGDGSLDAQDGFVVSSAALQITKTATLISEPFYGTGADRKAIPGAVIEYVITVENSGAVAADNVVITDTLSTDFTVNDDEYGANGELQLDNGGAVSTCSQEDSDTDNCEIVAGALSIGGDTPISVAAGSTLTITFRVTIN